MIHIGIMGMNHLRMVSLIFNYSTQLDASAQVFKNLYKEIWEVADLTNRQFVNKTMHLCRSSFIF